MRAWILFSALLTTACSGLWTPSEARAPEVAPAVASKPEAVPLTPPALNAAELELRIAKLWARVDGLENNQIRQRERMKLLEKGLMLGIVPEDLKGEKVDLKSNSAMQPPVDNDPPASVKNLSSEANTSTVAGEKSQDIAEYRRLLQTAQDKFNAANYGQAIVHFNEIGERFDDSITEGNQYYWIGLSWFYLKEYQLAEPSFRKLIDKNSQNSWVPYSRFYLAKIDLNRGLSGRARDQFKLLIDEYPNQDLSEMARMEIEKMREKL